MEFIATIILELLFEITHGAAKSSHIPKWLRILFFFILISFFIGVEGMLFFLGILTIKKNILAGLFLFFVAFLLLIVPYREIKNVYKSFQSK